MVNYKILRLIRTEYQEGTLNEYPLLKNAPIVEAVLDIQVALPPAFEVSNFDTIYQSFKGQYPKKDDITKFEGKFDFIKGAPATAINEKPAGYRFQSLDGKQIAQLRFDGFTFSRLTPYIDWEHLRGEAYNLWSFYKEITSPLIKRVALRFINRLNIPFPMQDFREYLTAPPEVPKALPQGVDSFLTRIAIYEPSIDAHAVITQMLEPFTKPDIAPIILDIDVFKLKPEGIDENIAWESLVKLRHLKNKIFFNSITDKLMEMYK